MVFRCKCNRAFWVTFVYDSAQEAVMALFELWIFILIAGVVISIWKSRTTDRRHRHLSRNPKSRSTAPRVPEEARPVRRTATPPLETSAPPPLVAPDWRAQISEHLAASRTFSAIDVYRAQTGASHSEASQAIANWGKESPPGTSEATNSDS
jgi:hypothetical protein